MTIDHISKSTVKKSYGDFQTPPDLADRVCRLLTAQGVNPRVLIEPTCGIGNFIWAGLRHFPRLKTVYAVEAQEEYLQHLHSRTKPIQADVTFQLHHDDIFTHSFAADVRQAQDILILGNPPWLTNAEATVNNIPLKSNLKGLRGLDALTGKSNFDLAEYITLHLLDIFSHQRGTLALLCKNQTIRNLIEILPKKDYAVADIRMYPIDAGREFGAAVDASLLVLTLGAERRSYTCTVAPLNGAPTPARTFGWINGKFVANTQAYAETKQFEGVSSLVWRQGLKHDCASIMELEQRNETFVNGYGQIADVEAPFLYPLLKSSDLKRFEIANARKYVIVPQAHIGQKTACLEDSAPKLWRYLTDNAAYLDNRKSRIYHDKPRYSIFGIGDYSFKPYKVVISGLYKQARFCVVPPIKGRPVMLDDTCYFIGFDTYSDAVFAATALMSAPIQNLLKALVFADAKRPYTKEVLMRLDIERVIANMSPDQMRDIWQEQHYMPPVSFDPNARMHFCSAQNQTWVQPSLLYS